VELTSSGEPVGQSVRQQLSVAEGIADAQRPERVLVTAGVAHQRPAWPVGPAQEIRQIGHAVESLFATTAADVPGELWHSVEHGHELALDVLPDGGHLRDRPGHEHGKEAVVRGEGEDDAATADVDAELDDWHTTPVGKVPAGGRWRGLVGRRLDGPRDERMLS